MSDRAFGWCYHGFFAAVVGGSLIALSCYNGGKTPGNSVQAEQTENISERFFTSLTALSEDPQKKEDYSKNIHQMANIVLREAQKNPEPFAYFLDEAVSLALKAGGPGIAIQVEGYASETVKQEMERLKSESSVARLLVLEKEAAQWRKVQDEVRKKEALFTKAVPVYLRGWSNGIAMVKVTNTQTQEIKNFAVSAGEDLVIYLVPGEYLAEFTSGHYPNVQLQSTLMVFPELRYDVNGSKYNGYIRAPGVLSR